MSDIVDTHMPGTMHVSAAILLMRIVSGSACFYHGSAILFGAFSGPGPQRFAASRLLPVAIVYLVGLAQVTGAVAILTGVLFRPLTLLVIATAFVLTGPGAYSLADWLRCASRRR